MCERSGKTGAAPGRTEEKRSGAPLRRGGVPQKIYWEGINLNKISKKIVSLVTMAAFALTLIPAAAFAAGPTSIQASQFGVFDSNGEITNKDAEVGEEFVAEFKVNVNDTTVSSDPLVSASNNKNIKLWATDKQGNITDAVVFGKAGNTDYLLEKASNSGTNSNVYKMTDTGAKVMNGSTVSVKFLAPGEYTLHAGVGALDWTQNVDTAAFVAPLTKLNQNADETVVTVAAASTETDGISFSSAQGRFNPSAIDAATGTTTLDLDEDVFEANGIDPATVVAKTDMNGDIVKGATFKVSSNSEYLTIEDDTVTTDNAGQFQFNFTLSKAGSYKIYLTNAYVDYTIVVNYDSEAENIKTIRDNAQTLLAGNDDLYNKNNNAITNMSSAILFEITDKKGGIITSLSPDEPATDAENANHSRYLSVKVPEGSALTADNLKLVSLGNGTFTLAYDGTNPVKDLIPGEYNVTVGLLSGDTATATFTLGNFGETKTLVLEMTAQNYTTGNQEGEFESQSYAITDKVTLGQRVTVNAKYEDENGIRVNARNAEYGFDGKAVDTNRPSGLADNQFLTKQDVAFNETMLGSTIKVMAVDQDAKQSASAELTVVDSYDTFTLEFDNDNGVVDQNNNVTVSVVGENGNVESVNGVLSAYVEDQSNENAKVTVDVAKDMTNGKDGKLIVYSDKTTTADIVVAVKAGNAIYAGTLHYTFGEPCGAGTSVVMFIGSTDTLVNNKVVTIDAAPYVENDRTYVPLRALAQDFGAKVNWDEETGDITITADDNTVVLKVGETAYTVNGEERNMDVAPVLDSAANRTLVPVRFVAEALGYNVTAISAADGTTSSVYFTI